MEKKEQITIFQSRLDALIETTAAEFDLTYAECVGILMIKVTQLGTPKEIK